MDEADEMGDKMVSALDNLANAAVQKNDTFEHLVAANKTLTDTNKRLQEDNRKLLSIISALSGKTTINTSATTSHTGGGSDVNWDPNGYCWSHGFKVKVGHSSATCKKKHSGHQDHLDAKRGDTQGGCMWHKTWKAK